MSVKKRTENTNRIRGTVFVPAAIVILFFVFHQAILLTKAEVSGFAIFSNFIPFIYLVGIPYLILGAIKRSKPAFILGALLTALFFLQGFYINLSPKTTDIEAITVLTHNLQVNSADKFKLETLFLENKPDVIFLQEVGQDYSDNELAAFAQLNGYDLLTKQPYGLAILSKTPIHEVPSHASQDDYIGQLFVETTIQGQRILLVNVHNPIPHFEKKFLSSLGLSMFWYTDDFRNQRTKEILTDLHQREEETIILGGDFNTNSYTVDYYKLSSTYQDAFKIAGNGMGFTWPNAPTPYLRIPLKTPMFRLDYIFTTHNITTQHAKKLSPTGSDHLPLIAILSLPSN